jgi:Kef-type K+ transport system membrane component KefB
MGLLVLAYIGSFLAGDRRIRGFGLPSGVEYVGLGFLLGPSVLDLVDRSSLETFDPVAEVALGWVALVLGLGFGVHRHRKTHTRPLHLALAALASTTSAVAIAVPLWLALSRFATLTALPRALVVAGAALACAETTRESVRWVTERYGAHGPLSSAVAELAQSDDLVPLVLLALTFGFDVPARLPWAMTPLLWAAATLGLGVVFGATAALMIGKELETDETWGTVLGVSVLCTGITARLGLSTLSAMFAMGVSLSLFSGHRQSLLGMVEPTERTVLHPLLLLAGARIDLRAGGGIVLPVAVGVVLAARLAAKALIGLVWQGAYAPARKAGGGFGMGLMSAGTLCMTVGLACALRFHGVVGDTVLAAAAASTMLGEFIGPFALRAALSRAGVVPAVSPGEPQETTAKAEV